MVRFRRVDPAEADELCAGLADIHLDALSAGMALGALDTMGRTPAIEPRFNAWAWRPTPGGAESVAV